MKFNRLFPLVLALLFSQVSWAESKSDFKLVETDPYNSVLFIAKNQGKSILLTKNLDKNDIVRYTKEAESNGWLFCDVARSDSRFKDGVTEIVNIMGKFYTQHRDNKPSQPTPIPSVPTVHPGIHWEVDYPTAMAKVTASKRLLVYFTTDPCVWCKHLEGNLENPEILKGLSDNFICLKLNSNSPLVQALQITAYPTMLIVDKDRNILDRHTGSLEVSELKTFLLMKAETNTSVPQTEMRPQFRTQPTRNGRFCGILG